MTLNVLIPQRFTDGLIDRLIQIVERRFEAGLIVNAVRGGEYLKAWNTEKVFTLVVGIASKMLFDKRFNLTPVRKLAREFTRSCQQNELLAERATQKQNVGMSIWHSLIIAREAI